VVDISRGCPSLSNVIIWVEDVGREVEDIGIEMMAGYRAEEEKSRHARRSNNQP
jgi:hypothetical protein